MLVLCLVLTLHIRALADMEGSTGPYTLESADKKYIFVMLRGCNHNDSVRLYPSDRYPESGLYLNDGSVAPLWTVDWCGNVLLPADGVHVVRTGHWARTYECFNQEAITFFAGGKLLKSYQVNDLITLPYLLPHSSSHFEWRQLITPEAGAESFTINVFDNWYPYKAGVVFNESAHTMALETLHGDNYVFDALGNAELISDPATILLLILLGVLFPVLLLNVKMVTTVRDNQVLVGLRLLWLQKRKIALAEIRRCSIQPRDSLDPELIVQKYAVWANSGVLIELMEGDWVFIGSKRPRELLEAIRPAYA